MTTHKTRDIIEEINILKNILRFAMRKTGSLGIVKMLGGDRSIV